MVQHSLAQDPLSGNLFVFRSRGGDKLKILQWDSDGFILWYKRLEAGTFRFPRVVDGHSVEVKASELAMLLEGIDLRSIKRSKRFRIPQK
jgi:transposase